MCNMGRTIRFKQSRGCIDQMFTVKKVCDKHLANCKDVFCALMDFVKAY